MLQIYWQSGKYGTPVNHEILFIFTCWTFPLECIEIFCCKYIVYFYVHVLLDFLWIEDWGRRCLLLADGTWILLYYGQSSHKIGKNALFVYTPPSKRNQTFIFSALDLLFCMENAPQNTSFCTSIYVHLVQVQLIWFKR